MSIKDLFGKTSRNFEEAAQDVESTSFIEEKTKQQERYQPQVDFSDPKNFVYYGSAELYYDAAIKRIYEEYPYDGSKAEQIAFEESASALERWLFDNKYPKTTGHVKLGTTGDLGNLSGLYRETTTPEYIRVWGGLHTNNAASTLDAHLNSSAKYDEDKNRNQNWNCDFSNGVTIEFWMKKDVANTNEAEVILDLWNGEASSSASRLVVEFVKFGTDNYIRLAIDDASNPISSKIFPIENFNTGVWMHFAISLFEEDSTLKIGFYINGQLTVSDFFSNTYSFQGKLDAFIGALQTDVSGNGSTGSGKFQGYLDEFRFWKTKRTSRQIKLNWFHEIGGGANTDDDTSDLGVYLKFNEGIVGNDAIDSVVLDYSGRLANGLWIGYENTTNTRIATSAMDESGFSETPSPIIYREHSDVSSLISEMQLSGSSYDSDRGESFFRSMPTWLQEEDNGNFRNLSQILASYMDTLHVQIKELTELKTKRYPIEGLKSSTLSSNLLEDKGFMISTMFETSEVYEKLASVNLQDNQFETELDELKNTIYSNIYNNLEKIYKTKGTEQSIRNLIRCFGVDDELIRLNLYTDGGKQYLSDKSRATSIKKKYINFNNPDSFDASIYSDSSANNANTFISDLLDGSRSAFTLEADIIVPYKKEVSENGYFATPFLSSSVMGFHEANSANAADLTWGSNDLQVYLVRDSAESKHAKFVLKSESGINEESDYIYDIYDNEHYNVALRIKPQTYPYAGGVTNTTPDYDIELYAVKSNFGEMEREVLLSTTLSFADGESLMECAKRVYVGAHRLNFSGAVREYSDIQVGGVRAWLDYLSNDEILEHNKDASNFGSRKSIDGSNPFVISNVQIPVHALTIFNWDFDTVSASDGSGEFTVEDTTAYGTDTKYGWIDDVIRRQCNGKGIEFALSDSSFVSNEFIQSYKKQLPESVYDASNIYIKGEQEINFSDDDDVSDNLFIMEKSPSMLISEEMLKAFSSTLEFANLFARPVNKYRLEYKDIAHARQLFFEKVESDIDFERFFEYFKWIDSSLSSMVNQLIPMSANFAGGIVDVIEPHILERDKYQRQIGLLNTITSTEASIRGVQELKYNWRVGHAPLSGGDNENCLWQRERRERDGGVANQQSQEINDVVTRQNSLEYTNPIALSGSIVYSGSVYATRRFSRPYSVEAGFSDTIHGGINYPKNKDRDMIKPLISPGGGYQNGAPVNVVLFGAGPGLGVNPTSSCTDVFEPSPKVNIDGYGTVGQASVLSTLEATSDEFQYLYRQKISKILPANLVSSSVDTGYSAKIAADFSTGYNLVNLHSDTNNITNEISIQGPFTNEHVGGRQSRHVHFTKGINPSQGYVTNSDERPEEWNVYIGALNPDTSNDGAFGFTTPDYSLGSPYFPQEKAVFYREERAKRPINIKNIQTIIGTGSHGNYTYGYEVMSTFGDQGYFLRRSGNLLPTIISDALPQTTHYFTLISQAVTTEGNIFGEPNNRQYDNRVFTSGQNAAQATGGEFTVLGVDRISQGDFITIDSTDYEIGTSVQGGETITDLSTNTAFYDNIESLLVSNFSNDFTIAYNETLTQPPQAQPGQTASGGTFKILGFDDVVSGEFITIDSVDYEIDTSVQGGETLLTTPTPASNTAFFNSLKSLLESNFPTNDFTVTFTEGDNGGTLPSSATPALSFRGDATGAGLEYSGTPSWAPSSDNSAFSEPFTISFYINAPLDGPTVQGNSRYIYDTLRLNSPGDGRSLFLRSTSGAWNLHFVDRYALNGAPPTNGLSNTAASWIFDDFVTATTAIGYGDQLTHVLLTTDGNRSATPIVQLYINGVLQTWSTTPTYPAGNHAGIPVSDFYIGTNGNFNSFLSYDTDPAELTILDEVMIFDAHLNTQAKVDEIYNSGNQLDHNNLTSLSTYSNLKVFYTFSETNDSVSNGGTIHSRIANSENLTVVNTTYLATDGNTYDLIDTANAGPPDAGTIVYHADFEIMPDNVGTYGNFTISVDPNYSSFPSANNEISDSTGGVDAIPALFDSEAEFTITPNNVGSYGNFNVTVGSGTSFSNTQNSVDGLDYIAPTVSGDTNIIQTQDRSIAASSVVRTRFSAPGGPEINSSGYLDIATQEYSVHNSLNFRNLTVRGPSSGEDTTIKVNSHNNRREGLKTLRARHSGQFGLDPVHTTVPEASWHKQHRNSSMKLTPQVESSKAFRLYNATHEYMLTDTISAAGQIPAGSNSMTISFWLNSDSNNANEILEITNSLFITLTSANTLIVSMLDSQGNARAANAIYNNIDTLGWNQYIISIDFDNLFNTRVEISGVAPDSYQFSASNFVGGWRGLGAEVIRIGQFSVNSSTGLMGAIMNLCYFDSFIFDNAEDLQTLREHKRYADIRHVSSLVNFWSFGEEMGLAIGDSVPDQTTIQSSHLNMTDTFTVQLPQNLSNGHRIVEGFYTHYNGTNSGDKRNDNVHLNSLLPATDFQFSWVNNVIGTTSPTSQPILNMAPRSGVVATSNGYVSAIDFPTISDVACEACFDNESIDARVSLASVFDFTEQFTLTVIQAGTSTSSNILFSDLANLQFNGDYVGCCAYDREFSIVQRYTERQYEAAPTLPTLYYSPDCSVELEYSVRRCGVEDSVVIRLIDASLIQPTVDARIFYEILSTPGASTTDLTLTWVQTPTTPTEFASATVLDTILFSGTLGPGVCCSDLIYTILEEDGVQINTTLTESPTIPYSYANGLQYSPSNNYTITVRVGMCDQYGVYEDITLTIENAAPVP